MSLAVMKKTIDFAMEKSREMDSLSIGFYGGEPLLKIDRIRECVDYVKKIYDGRKVRYILTTNGTLFDDSMINFLMENDISILISLDGPKEVHNKKRVYANGQGSFDDILKNMEYIKKNYPQFFSKIQFMTTVAPDVDLSCISDFFDAETLMSENVITQNRVSAIGAKEDIIYGDQYYLTDTYQQVKILLAALGMYPEEKTSQLFTRFFTQVERLHRELSRRMPVGITHPGGPCIPGAMRLFVAVDGTLYPCERVSEDSEIMKIGHVDTGFDLKKLNYCSMLVS